MQYNKSITNDNIHFHHHAVIQQLKHTVNSTWTIICFLLRSISYPRAHFHSFFLAWSRVVQNICMFVDSCVFLLLGFCRRHTRWRDATLHSLSYHFFRWLRERLLFLLPLPCCALIFTHFTECRENVYDAGKYFCKCLPLRVHGALFFNCFIFIHSATMMTTTTTMELFLSESA